MNNAVMFSSATDEWSTPQDFFERYRREFDLCVDVAASRENRKCLDYFGPDNHIEGKRDGLTANWSQFGSLSRCWMNPPYSRGLQGKFIAKAAQERLRGVLTVALLPARTDTKAFHAHIYDASKWQPREGVEIRLLPGRLKFGGAANSAPFPSMVVVFRP
jgi:phage N-6-adenine-methyltransferase